MDGLGRHILAAYYNDTRLNILSSLNHIRASLNLPDKENDADIIGAYTEIRLLSRPPELQANIIKKLRGHFRFLDPLTGQKTQNSALPKNQNSTVLESETATPEQYETKMFWMLRQVNAFRNATVHPTLVDQTPIDAELHRDTYHDLYKVYDSALAAVKERFSLDEKILIKPLRSWKETQDTVFENGKPRKISKRKAISAFSLAITRDPKSKDQNPLTRNILLHDFGHVLFCSLLLNRHQSAELLAYFWRSTHGAK